MAITGRQLAALPPKDQALLMDTDPKNLAELDEDGLIALLDRVRRSRNRFVSQYRRAGAANVRQSGKRGGSPAHVRERAEILESALARVSRALSAAARHAAADLKRERLEAVKGDKPSAPKRRKSAAGPEPASRERGRKELRTPRKKAERAKVQASGARNQAKRDAKMR